jgi:hypothetical protein
MRAINFAGVLVATLVAGLVSEQANAVTVDYTLTFTGTSGDKTNGTGTLVVNETTPLSSFTENSYGDLVSLTATIGGLTYSFLQSSVAVDLGTNQTFYSITGSSSPGVVGPNNLVGTLVLGGFGFNITNPGGPNLDNGSFTIGQGVVQSPAATPLPPTWSIMALGLVGFGFLILRGKKWRMANFATA